MNRRSFLGRSGLAVAGASALTGCLDGSPADGGSADTDAMDDGADAGTPIGDTTTATTAGAGPFGGHAAAAGIRDQPFLGPEPGEATATIVAFEDPSCPRCAAFERDTVPEIRSELVEPGRATFVFRGYPVVYEWGKPATQALEATVARDADAHWALADHYFAEQDAFSADDVLERTGEFLGSETDVDADGVVADARARTYDGRVQADLDAGDAAGAGGVTPTVFLFREGEYRTKARGSVSYATITAALGL